MGIGSLSESGARNKSPEESTLECHGEEYTNASLFHGRRAFRIFLHTYAHLHGFPPSPLPLDSIAQALPSITVPTPFCPQGFNLAISGRIAWKEGAVSVLGVKSSKDGAFVN